FLSRPVPLCWVAISVAMYLACSRLQGVGTQPNESRGTHRCCRPPKFCFVVCPLYPQKRTLFSRIVTSRSCQYPACSQWKMLNGRYLDHNGIAACARPRPRGFAVRRLPLCLLLRGLPGVLEARRRRAPQGIIGRIRTCLQR